MTNSPISNCCDLEQNKAVIAKMGPNVKLQFCILLYYVLQPLDELFSVSYQ